MTLLMEIQGGDVFSHALVVYEYFDLGERKSMVKWRFPSFARVNSSCTWVTVYPLHLHGISPELLKRFEVLND